MEPRTFEELLAEADQAFEQAAERAQTGNLVGSLRSMTRGAQLLLAALRHSQDAALGAAQRAGVPEAVEL